MAVLPTMVILAISKEKYTIQLYTIYANRKKELATLKMYQYRQEIYVYALVSIPTFFRPLNRNHTNHPKRASIGKRTKRKL